MNSLVAQAFCALIVLVSLRSARGAENWPQWRGPAGNGTSDSANLPTEWSLDKNILWRAELPSWSGGTPVVWGDRVFVTTAIGTGGDTTFRTGLYGDVKPVDDLSEHEWKLYSLDKATGKIIWERTAHKGTPGTKRHTKSSQASSTPVTVGFSPPNP